MTKSLRSSISILGNSNTPVSSSGKPFFYFFYFFTRELIPRLNSYCMKEETDVTNYT